MIPKLHPAILKPNSESMNAFDILYILFLVGSSAICGLTYGIFFDSMSETTMVNISFGWVFFLVTGGMGMLLKSSPNRHVIAFVTGIGAVMALVAFFVVVWPSF